VCRRVASKTSRLPGPVVPTASKSVPSPDSTESTRRPGGIVARSRPARARARLARSASARSSEFRLEPRRDRDPRGTDPAAPWGHGLQTGLRVKSVTDGDSWAVACRGRQGEERRAVVGQRREDPDSANFADVAPSYRTRAARTARVVGLVARD
jgi:hypothetical protein